MIRKLDRTTHNQPDAGAPNAPAWAEYVAIGRWMECPLEPAKSKAETMTDAALVRLAALNLSLPPAPAPAANYVPYIIDGEHLYVSGQGSRMADGSLLSGRLGADLTVEQGQEAAAACALNILAQAHAALGRLDRIGQIIRLTGYVNSTPDFSDHPLVINGASDMMVNVLGDAGRHTRDAVGVAGLPGGCAVEVDAILRIRDE